MTKVFIQCNFSHIQNVMFEEQELYKMIRKNTFTSDYWWFNKFVVAKWKVTFKKYFDSDK